MSIKADVKGDSRKHNTYPRLMVGECGRVALVSCEYASGDAVLVKGTFLTHSDSNDDQIGRVFDDHYKYLFKDFDGQITLSNE